MLLGLVSPLCHSCFTPWVPQGSWSNSVCFDQTNVSFPVVRNALQGRLVRALIKGALNHVEHHAEYWVLGPCSLQQLFCIHENKLHSCWVFSSSGLQCKFSGVKFLPFLCQGTEKGEGVRHIASCMLRHLKEESPHLCARKAVACVTWWSPSCSLKLPLTLQNLTYHLYSKPYFIWSCCRDVLAIFWLI